ncbi:MAG: hypothetical protein HGB36_02645 [Chlorobiaceae bacterium]|nr:hypothetical protein [Chlorobiaceae bacterium]
MSIKREKNQETDQELVIRTLADNQTFSLLVRRYDAPLLRYILRMGWKDNSSVQDLLQEIFIKAYIHLNDYDQSLSFSSWIYRIAHNEIVSSYLQQTHLHERTSMVAIGKRTPGGPDYFIR